MLEDLSELLLEVARFRKVVFQIIGRLGLDPGSLHCNRQPGTPLTPEHLPLAPASLGNEGPLNMPPSFGAHASAGSACTEPDQCHRVQTIPDACLGPRCRAPQSLRLDSGSQNLLRNDKASGQFPHLARTRPAHHLADRAAHRLQNLRIGCTQLLSCTLQTRFVDMQINHCCCTASASNAMPVPSGCALVTTS